ncbi:MAG: AAA family ATPase [Candidatus Acidifodinimicrobium sp.]
MIINKIDLDNIRSHFHSSIEFKRGINVIVGNTGSGKSSILMGIEYALFGKIGEGQNEGRLLLRRGSNSGSVSLVFTENGDEIHVTRGLKRVKDAVRNDDSLNKVSVNGREVDLQNRSSDISKFVSKSLSMSSDPLKTFEAVVYIKQDELKNLVFDTTQRKQEYIDDTLQVGKYAAVYEGLKPIILEMQNEAALLRKEIEFSVSDQELIDTRNKLLDIDQNIKSLEKSIEDGNAVVSKLIQDKKACEEKLEREKEIQLKFDVLRSLIEKEIKEEDKLRGEIKDLQDEKDVLSSKMVNIEVGSEESLLNSLKELDISIRKLTADKDQKVKEIHELQMKISVLNDRKNKLAEDLSKNSIHEREIERMISENRALLEKTLGSLTEDEANARIDQIKEFIRELTEDKEKSLSSGTCVFCGSKITDKSHVEKEFESRLKRHNDLILRFEGIKTNKTKPSRSSIEKELFSLEKELSNTKAEIERLKKESDLIKVDEFSKRLEVLGSELEEIEREINALLDDKLKISKKLDEMSKSRTLLNRLESINSEIDQKMKSLQEKELTLQKNRSDLSSLNFDVSVGEELKRELERIEGEYNKAASKLAEDRKEKAIMEERKEEETNKLKEITEKLRAKENANIKLAKLDKGIKLLSNLREDIRSIREYVRNRFIGEFRSLFQAKFYELRSETDYAVDIDNNYNINIRTGEDSFESKGLSGGEKTIVALAYRISLSSIAASLGGISHNDIFIMDEPTSGLDKKDVSALADSITRIAGVNQIIIVTHDDNLKNIADNIIQVEKRDGKSLII